MPSLSLIPAPRLLSLAGGSYVLPDEMFIALDPHAATRDLFAAERFVIEAEALTGSRFHISLGYGADTTGEIRVRFDGTVTPEAPEAVWDQAYVLTITSQGVDLAARAVAGVFYGFQTLLQIVRQYALADMSANRGKNSPARNRRRPLKLPVLRIVDYPDFARRGVYHDTARGKVPTVDTLLQLIDDLGHLKYNEFQLYIENNFQFRKHPEMYDDTDPFTTEELLLLDGACRARHMDFVPSLTSLGHFEKILSRPKFRSLAEAEPAQLKAIGATCLNDWPWSLCVTDPAAKALLKDMYEEFVPNFSSGYFNICCDEAYDLGAVRSKELADKVGVGQLYVDWIQYCHALARSQGKSIQMWGDIILNHPQLIPQLPDDATLLEWGYEHDHQFNEHCAIFKERLHDRAKGSGWQRFYVCPGTSSWLTFTARTKNAFANIHNAAAAGLKYGAAGLLVTDWGDNGHQQMLAVSITPFAYGAAAGWNLAATPNPKSALAGALKPLLKAISLHWFQDPSGQFAALADELGLTYERLGSQRKNSSLEWWLFREKWEDTDYVHRVKPRNLAKVIDACKKLIPAIKDTVLLHPDAEQIRTELLFTCEEVIHTCRRTLLRQVWMKGKPPASFRREMRFMKTEIAKLQKQFSKLWLARNKRSRLKDVVVEFQRLADEYRQFAAQPK